MSKKIVIGIRKMVPQDRPYIIATWRRAQWDFLARQIHKDVRKEIVTTNHPVIIENLLDRYTTFVAYDPANKSSLLGYVCADRINGILLLHYVYVNKRFRNLGIARALLSLYNYDEGNEVLLCSHWSKPARKYCLVASALFNPYLAFSDFQESEDDERAPAEVPHSGVIQFERKDHLDFEEDNSDGEPDSGGGNPLD